MGGYPQKSSIFPGFFARKTKHFWGSPDGPRRAQLGPRRMSESTRSSSGMFSGATRCWVATCQLDRLSKPGIHGNGDAVDFNWLQYGLMGILDDLNGAKGDVTRCNQLANAACFTGFTT